LGKAAFCYKKAFSYKPDFALAYYHFAKIANQNFKASYFSSRNGYFSKIHQLLDSPNLPDKDKSLLNFSLGEMYDNCSLYDSAFEHYQHGNRIRRSQVNFSFTQLENYTGQILNTFKINFWDETRLKGSSTLTPIFIVGLPRSGKSMTERLISSHKKVFGAGETNIIRKLICRTLPVKMNSTDKFPECVIAVNDQTVLEIVYEYEKYLSSLAGGVSYDYIVDTMPSNHQFLGMIALMFPAAKIIFCRRNALDNCLAVYFKFFVEGIDYAYDFEEIAFYYGQYLRLMDYWKSVLPLSIYEINYEDLVKNTEEMAHKLMAYLNLEWNRECSKAFNKMFLDNNEKNISQKIISNHKRGIGWSSKYKKHLGPLQKSLQKCVIKK
jgi:hypothetical protein